MKNEKYKKIFDIVCDIISFILIFLFCIPIVALIFSFASDISLHSTITEEISNYYRIRDYFIVPVSFLFSLILNFRIVRRILRKFNLLKYKKYFLWGLIGIEVALFSYVMFIY